MKVEEIYHLIAQELSDSLKGEWSSALVEIKRMPDMIGYSAFYFTKNNEKEVLVDLKFTFPVIKAMKELHEITSTNDVNKWNKANFTLLPDGKFEMDFIWDQAYQDEYEAASKS